MNNKICHIGIRPSKETRQNMSRDRKGKLHKEITKQKMAKSHKGKWVGELCSSSKLTSEQVICIRADRRRHNIIAIDYNISTGNVGDIKRRKTWKHI